MSVSNGKLRLLATADFFKKYTDEENIFSAAEICDFLEKQGISVERKAFYTDVDALRESGMDIVCTRSPKKGYFLASRHFEEAEARLMIDAVQAAKFITAKKTDALVSKISSLMSNSQAKKLSSQVYIDRSRKRKNEEIYYTIDALHNAIIAKKQVKFTYRHLSVDADMQVKFSEREFTVSPYALIWSNDHYYLVCNNANYDNLMHTRLDRMKGVEQLDLPARPFSLVSSYTDKFDSADYAGKLFNMFSGSEQQVTMRCSNRILEEIVERFGENLQITSQNANTFTAKVIAVTGEGFVSWVLQYATDIKIISPKSLQEAVCERATQIANVYSK